MNIGIIGLGRLGGALARGLCGGPNENRVYAFNRTRGKAVTLAARHPGLSILDSEREVLETCDPVFVWTKPEDALTILSKNADLIRIRQPLLVSCSLDVPLAEYATRWAKCHPNVNMAVRKGVTLVQYAPDLSDEDRTLIHGILSRIGTVYACSAEDLPFYSGLTSCGPALYATMLETLVDTMAARRGYDGDTCRRMVLETVLGTMLLQDEDGIDAAEVVRRVAHPGGSSERGVTILESILPDLYERMLVAMKKW